MVYSKKDTYERVVRRVEYYFRDFLDLHPECQKIVNHYLEDEEYYKEIILSVINDLDRIRRYSCVLYAKTWVLYHNASTVKVITSDNPIIRYNFKYDKLGVPISGEQTFIGFPFTPEYYLTIIPNDYLLEDVQVAKNRCYEIGEESRQTIQFWNQLQTRNATQFIYGVV